MSEIRVDPLSGLRTIVAPVRAARPRDVDDPFAEGSESQTPPEIYAVRPQGSPPDTPGWRVRVFPNRYPALEMDGSVAARDANPDIFTALQQQLGLKLEPTKITSEFVVIDSIEKPSEN